jgi:hypothetical protein
MKELLLTLLHLAVMTTKLCGPGGVRAVIAENLLLKQQLVVLRRARLRAPNLTLRDRLLCGFGSLFLSPGRIRSFGLARRGFRSSIGGVHSLTEENPRRVLIVGATVAERDARQLPKAAWCQRISPAVRYSIPPTTKRKSNPITTTAIQSERFIAGLVCAARPFR